MGDDNKSAWEEEEDTILGLKSMQGKSFFKKG